jgi:hypothetical protein
VWTLVAHPAAAVGGERANDGALVHGLLDSARTDSSGALAVRRETGIG